MRTVAEVTLDREPDAVPRARRLVRSALTEDAPELAADAELVVSELVTNAALHGEAPITVRVLIDRVVRIEVEDNGRQVPILLRQRPDAMTGRGLAMVATVVSRWGVETLESGGKTVWAEIHPDPLTRMAVASPPQINVDALFDAYADDDPSTAAYTVKLGPVSTELLLAAKAHIDNVVRELALMREGEASSGVALPAELSALIQTVTIDFAEARTEIKRQAASAAARGETLTDLELHLSPSAADAGERYLDALDQADRYGRSAHFLTLAPPHVHRVFRRWYVGESIRQLRDLSRGLIPSPAVPLQVILAEEVAALGDASGSADRLATLEKISRELAGAVSVEQMAEVAVDHAIDFPGVASARVRVAEPGGTLRSLAWRGPPGRQDPRPDDLPIDSGLPSGVAVLTRRPLLIRSHSAPIEPAEWVDYHEPGRNGHVVPLVVGEEALGVLTLSFVEGEMSDEAEHEFANVLADVLAHAIRRAGMARDSALATEAVLLLDRIPGAALGVDDSGVITGCNPAAALLLGVEGRAAVGQALVSILPQRFRDAHRAAFAHLLATGEGELLGGDPFVVPVLKPDGSEMDVELTLTSTANPLRPGTVALVSLRAAAPNTDRGPHPVLGRFLDASVGALAGQKDVLERMVAGEPLPSVLDALVRVIETSSDSGARGVILLLDPDGRHLRFAAGPSLPQGYGRTVEGIEIGPEAGGSGRAAHLRTPVVVEDIVVDPLLVRFSESAVAVGLRAAWATPIIAGDGDLLGTFTVYYPQVGGPSQADQNLMGLLVHTAAVAIARARADRLQEEALAHEQAAREELERAHQNLSFVLEATTRVASSLDSDDTLRTLARIAVPALADVCLIDLFDGSTLKRAATAASDTVDREDAARLGRFSPDPAGPHPAAQAVRTRAPAFLEAGPEEFDGIHVDSCVGIPLTARGRTIGAMTLVMLRPGRRYAESDVDMVEDLAGRVALAISNEQLYEDSRDAEERLALVARAGVSLTSSLDLDTVAARLCDLITGEIADRCEVYVRRAPGQWWRYSPRTAIERLVRADSLPALVEACIQSAQTGAAQTATAQTATAQSGGDDVVAVGAEAGTDATSSVVPLVAHGEVVGVISMASFGGHGPARVPADTVAVIADRAALAIDNALLYEQERIAAEILQRSLLPHHLPFTLGLRSAARYLPAGARNEVGGDWYDLIPVSPGRVAVVMGDVMGRGIPAASIMGQLRNGLRMLAMQRLDPATVLGLLNRLLGPDEDSPLATVAFGVLDVPTLTLSMANAGHLPPLIIRSGSSFFLDQKAGLPLGAFPDAAYTTAEHRLAPGDALIMYTDGLIEQRDRSLEEGLAQLLDVAAGAPLTDPDAVCDVLLSSFRRESDEDDTAALVILLDAAGA